MIVFIMTSIVFFLFRLLAPRNEFRQKHLRPFVPHKEFLGWGRIRAVPCCALTQIVRCAIFSRRALFPLLPFSLSPLLLLPCTARADAEVIQYTVSIEGSPVPKRVRIVVSVPGRASETVRVRMPVWSPGDYAIQNHGKYVQEMQTQQNGKPLVVTHPDANTWEATPKQTGAVRFSYALETTPPGNFSQNVYVTDRQVFLNGAGAFVYADGAKEMPCRLALRLPENWSVFTSPCLKPQDKNTFAAADYDRLADSPLIIARDGFWNVKHFEVEGKPHRVILFGAADKARFADDYPDVCRRIVEAGSKVMGGLVYPGYDFDIDVNGKGGGLEHACCARLAIGSETPPQRQAGFLAHEFFHNWNVKRIRPKVLGPFDYLNPPQTGNLWFAEGVTEYYSIIITRRAGLRSEREFLAHWRDAIEDFQNNDAQTRVTAEEASRRVWETGRSQGYGGLSYYQKGELMGLCFDLKIRALTNGKKTLDDVMRELLKRTQPPHSGYEEDGVLNAINTITGADCTEFYTRLARTTQPLPFAECLRSVGLDAQLNSLPDASAAQIALRRDWMRRN